MVKVLMTENHLSITADAAISILRATADRARIETAAFDANLGQRFFGVYSYCEKLKTEQDEING
jgi:hypothetical protein